MSHLEAHVLATGELAAVVNRIAAREIDPHSAAKALIDRAVAAAPSSRTI
jgi:hypothetical protein